MIEITSTDGRVIVWHLIVVILQSFTNPPGTAADKITHGINANESPAFTNGDVIIRCSTEIAAITIANAIIAWLAQWQTIQEPSSFGSQALKKVLIPTK